MHTAASSSSKLTGNARVLDHDTVADVVELRDYSADPDRIAGVLDFGDMVRTPRICDLAVAAAYHVQPGAGLASLAEVTAGWAAILPLTPDEAALLPGLTALRMVTTLALTSHRAARWPDNAAYILRNFPSAEAGLLALPPAPDDLPQGPMP